MIKFNCPHCEIQIEAESEHAGASANCPSCEGDVVVPSAPSEAEPDHTVDSSMQQELQSPPANGTSEVLGSMRKKLGDLRDQIAASDAPRHAMEAMKKKATEIRDQVAASELPRKALDSAKEKAAHLRDQVAASELPKEALDAARKKVSQARDYAATSETPKVALAWLKKSMVKPRYITVMLALMVGLFAVNRYSKESIVPTARIEAAAPAVESRREPVLEAPPKGKSGLEWEVNRAISVLADIYPELSKKELMSKLEEIYGKQITTISDAKRALYTLEQLKHAAIIAGESQRSFFNKSDESRSKFQKDVKRSRGPN